jgi:voltage-gated potassium channel
MRTLRLLWLVIKRSGAMRMLVAFLLALMLCAVVILLAEPGVETYGDALWFLWAVSTTVGLGDITAVTATGRIAVVVCSIFAIVTTAILTAVVVDFFNERRQQQLDESVSLFLDKLERLPELSKAELEAIARRVRTLRR